VRKHRQKCAEKNKEKGEERLKEAGVKRGKSRTVVVRVWLVYCSQ